MMNSKLQCWLAGALLAVGLSLQAQPGRIAVALDQPGHRISPTLWGIFFEDINHSADGGIYPELVRNGSFEDARQLEHWQFACRRGGASTAAIDESRPLNPFNRRSLRIQMEGAFSLENEGYWGMSIAAGQGYAFKAAARALDGFTGPLTVRLLSAAGQELARGTISGLTGDWQYYPLDLTATATDAKAKLQLSASGRGVLFLDMVSLLPKDTWKGHGLRVDLAEALNGLQPSFMRFPGGCWVEGDTIEKMYNWKKTIGDVDVRTPLWNIWGYNATHGLGFHEYLLLCEDLGAAPLFCINVGMSHKEVVPLDRMGQWVQDALDAIEYANGPTNSIWGARRAVAGHPAPFNLRYIEIGNENGGAAYAQRWPLFVKAIKDRYPDMQLIANHWQGGYPKTPMPDLVDEHYYESPEAFMRRAAQYDNYDRHGPKVFVGEYAVTRNCGLGNLRAAIGEAAFMTGLERNSDVVVMASYAPLFVNLNHRAWNPDLINFDSARWYGLPSYYVQQLFSQHRGDVTLPVQVHAPAAEVEPGKGLIGVGTWNTQAEFKDIQVTAPDGKVLFASDFSAGTQGWQLLGGGNWKTRDGALCQTAEKEFVRALAGERDWTDYTLELKARKLGGREGFLVLFHINDREGRTWWNLGGWGNTQDAVEYGGILDPKPDRIETGRWYDLRVEIRGRQVKCYRDGQLVHDIAEVTGNVPSLYTCASREERTGDVIIKVVNATAAPLDTQLAFAGAPRLTGQGTAFVLSSGSGQDENSLAAPTKVSPHTLPVRFTGARLARAFPGNSLTVLRLKAER